jgi:hypothetical protein
MSLIKVSCYSMVLMLLPGDFVLVDYSRTPGMNRTKSPGSPST